ncbi:MAG: hypothetical protein JWO88_3248 [Frankiales bacterium]|nr:hypothetical protein [Frankiales bacterium]
MSRVVLAAQVVAGPTNVLTALAVGLGLSDSLTAIVFAFYAVPLSGLVLLLTCVAIGREEHLSRVLWSWIAPALAPALLLLGGMVGSLLR